MLKVKEVLPQTMRVNIYICIYIGVYVQLLGYYDIYVLIQLHLFLHSHTTTLIFIYIK